MNKFLFKIKIVFVVLIVLSAMMYSCKKENTSNLDNFYSPASLARSATFPVGCWYEPHVNAIDSAYANIIKNEFNSITGTVEMYVLWPNGPSTDIDFTKTDLAVEYAGKYKKTLNGHVLAWYYFGYEYACPWIYNFNGTNDEFEAIYKNYIQTVVRRYKGKFTSYNVINEAVNDFAGVGGITPITEFKLRDDYHKRYLGDNYVYKIFKWVEEADPNTLLIYNDYNLEIFPEKLKKVLEILDDARSQGAKIDGVGFQAHIHFPNITTYEAYYRAFKAAADKGYKVFISELDIPINGPLGLKTKPDRSDLLKQETYYRTITRAYIDAVPPQLRHGITVWGASDKYSWYRNVPYWLFNKNDWPCLYDSTMVAKPAYFGFRDALTRSL